MKIKCVLGPALAFLLIATPIGAAEEKDQPDVASLPTTPLADILDAVSKNSGKKFLIDARAPRGVVVGQLSRKEVTYSSLLIILRNNDLAAVTIGDFVNIVAGRSIRQYPLPIVNEDDDSIDGEEWVTRVINLKNAQAAQMVPIMRPLLPQAGHLAANPPSNTIMIVDRYANVKRVTEMILAMDASTPPQSSK
jgi:general secretion pathway protein D